MNAPVSDREPTSTAVRRASHPLDRLTADEINEAREVLRAAGLVAETTRFAYLGLEEPAKEEVLAFRPGDPIHRRARPILPDVRARDNPATPASLTPHHGGARPRVYLGA